MSEKTSEKKEKAKKETSAKSKTPSKPAAKKVSKDTAKSKPAPKPKAEKKAPATKKKDPQIKKYSNDRIDVTVTIDEHCKVQMDITAKKGLIKDADKAAVKELAKDVSLPGFRKGKVPKDILAKRFKGQIISKALQHLADSAFKEAQQLAKVPVLYQSKVNYTPKEAAPDFTEDAIEMMFSFETEPVIELKEVKLDTSKIKKQKVSEKDVKETLHQIRKFYATTSKVEDRSVKENDIVFLDIEDLDSEPPQKVFDKQRFEVTETGMADWMRKTVVGMNPGDQKEAISKPNKSDPEKVKKEFKEKKVRVTLLEFFEETLPAEDDDLATKLGVKTLKELKEALKEQLEKRADLDWRKQARDLAAEALVAQVDIELPQTAIMREFEHRLKRYQENSLGEKPWADMSTDEKKEKEAAIKVETIFALKLFFISRQITESENIKIEDPSKAPQPSSMLEAMFTDRSQRLNPQDPNQHAMMMTTKMIEAAEDFVIDSQTSEKTTVPKKKAASKSSS